MKNVTTLTSTLKSASYQDRTFLSVFDNGPASFTE